MRKSFEKVRVVPVIGRILYAFVCLGHKILPASRRERIMTVICGLIRYHPAYCRYPAVWGLNRGGGWRTPRIIVSLTSYPRRITTVYRTIETLLTQSYKPDAVILWLAGSQFKQKEGDLPKKLLRLKSYGLEIRWCEDLRSYKKLIPALKEFSNDIIVTADDDVFYRPDWLEKLYRSYEKNKLAIHCHIARRIKIEGGQCAPYAEWDHSKEEGIASLCHLAVGAGGILYPPNCFYKDVGNVELFRQLAHQADDLWFWAMAVLAGHAIQLVEGAQRPDADCAADMSEALEKTNAGEGLNDVQFQRILMHFKTLRDAMQLNGSAT